MKTDEQQFAITKVILEGGRQEGKCRALNGIIREDVK